MVFTFPTNVLISHLKAALRFVSTDDTRPEIACLRIEGRGNEARFMATDGYRLWVAAAPMKKASTVALHGALHISRFDAICLATKLIDKKVAEITIEYAADHTVTVTQGPRVHTFKAVDLERLEKAFPNFTTLFTTMVPAETPRVSVSINGEYLTDAAASFADIRDPALMKALRSSIRVVYGATSFEPFTISEDGTSALLLIMPVQGEKYADTMAHITGLIERFSAPLIPSRRKQSA